MEIDKKLIQLREHAGISQNELAEEMHVTRQTVSRWENGMVTPPLDVLKDLTKFYGVTLDWLCNDEADMREIESSEKPPVEELQPTEAKHDRLAGRKKILLGIAAAILAVILLACILRWREQAVHGNAREIYVTQVEIPEDNGFDLNWEK